MGGGSERFVREEGGGVSWKWGELRREADFVLLSALMLGRAGVVSPASLIFIPPNFHAFFAP